jgi:RNA polymerase sigma-70 factor, ECF subfamily
VLKASFGIPIAQESGESPALVESRPMAASWGVMNASPIPGDLLREHLQALGALAQRLVGDRHAAEDAVQDTMVAALLSETPRRGALRSWLAAILKNRLRQDARAESRRRAREQARPAATESPAASEVASELQLHRRLLELVHGLEPASRQTLFLRFWRGLSPGEIAAVLAIPEKTVHARIERALLRLRQQLDNAHNGRGTWVAVLAAIVPTTPTALSLAGLGLLMKTKLIVSAFVVITVLALLPLLDRGVTPQVPEPAAPGPVAAMIEIQPGTAMQRTAVAPGESLPVEVVAPDVAPDVVCFVRDLGGRPIAGVAVVFERLQGTTTASRDPAVPPMTSAADGSFTLAWPGREGWLTVAGEQWAPVRRAWCRIEPPSESPVVLVALARRYAGNVVDPNGAPIAGASVTVAISGTAVPSRSAGSAIVALPNDLGTVTTDAQGHFTFPPVGWIAGAKVVADYPPFRAANQELPWIDTDDLLLQLQAPPDDPRVYGIVLDARGQPTEGAIVAVGGDSVRTGSDGRFAAPWHFGMRPTRVRAVQAGTGAAAALLVPGTDQPGWHPDRPITLQLPDAVGEVRGRVVDADGSPLGGVHVWTPDLTWLGNVDVDHQGHQLSSPSSVEGVVNDPNSGIDAILELGTDTDADGRFVLRGLTARPYPLFAMAPITLASAGPVMANPGDSVELRLARPTLHRVSGQIVAAIGGEPLASVRVSVGRRLAWQRPQRDDDPWAGSPMQPAGASHGFRELSVTTDAEGRFALPPLMTDGAYLSFAGEPLFLASPFSLTADQPLEQLRIPLPARSTFQLQLDQPGEADKFWIEAIDGEQQPLFVRVEGAVISAWRVELAEGRSPAAYTRAGEAVVVLSKHGTEVRRERVMLRAGEHALRL